MKHKKSKYRRSWWKYFRPKWLNSISWKEGDIKIYKWLWWVYKKN